MLITLSTATRVRRTSVRLVLAACAAGVVTATGVAASPASAHVTVSSPDAAAGDYGKLVFRVPTESETASTERLTVQLPTRMPFASVSAKPKAGWSVHTEETKLPEPVTTGDMRLTKAVTTVTWKAENEAATIPPGGFDEFELSVGPFPAKGGTLVASAAQAYTDGSVVRWDQKPTAGSGEPEHPAPTLDVPAAASGSATPSPEPARVAADSGGDVPARVLGGVAALLAVVALALAVRRRRIGDGAT